MERGRDVAHRTVLTDEQIRAMEDKVGVTLTREIAEDHNWVYDEIEELERAHAREHGHKAITITPAGHFDLDEDPGPLIEVLRRGEADAETQAWLADKIEREGFAARKSVAERIEALGPLFDAVMEVPEIERLLRSRGDRRGVHDNAMLLAALHNGVALEDLKTHMKRGRKDRHRVV
jgi:hypothetical protein